MPGHPYRILIISDSGSGKTINKLLNLINNHPNIDKVYIHAKDLHAAKYQYLITKKRKYRIKAFLWSKSFHWVLIWYALRL